MTGLGQQPSASSARRSADDFQLAARLAAGDQTALAEIYDCYGGLVYGLARRVLGDRALAEDVTQEVFVYLWQHPEHFDASRGTLRTWLGLIAHRRSVDRVRAEVRRTKLEGRPDAVDAGPADQFDVVERELSGAWLAHRVKEALEQLPVDQREAIVLAYYRGLTYRQVAAELDIPEGTAKSRLRLGLGRLNQLLGSLSAGEDVPRWT
jgi:RNA polymerase sigma-70 factor (ECF subfamily)